MGKIEFGRVDDYTAADQTSFIKFYTATANTDTLACTINELQNFDHNGKDVYNISNLGIGITTVPTAALEVHTSRSSTTCFLVSGNLNSEGIKMWVDDSVGYIKTIQEENEAGYANLLIQLGDKALQAPWFGISNNTSGSSVHLFRILSTGKTGIGTTAPDRFLEINVGAATDGMRLTYNDANGSATVYSDFLIDSNGDLNITATGGDFTFGSGAAGVDYTIQINGETNDFLSTWMEDEDYLKLSDDILMNSTEMIMFRDTGLFIRSNDDGVMDIDADTRIDFNINTTAQINLTSGKLAPNSSGNTDLGDSTHIFNEFFTRYISTDSNELLAHDVVRHTFTAEEHAFGHIFNFAWSKATTAKIVNMTAVILDATDSLVKDQHYGSFDLTIYYSGSYIYVEDVGGVMDDGDIVTVYIVYEK